MHSIDQLNIDTCSKSPGRRLGDKWSSAEKGPKRWYFVLRVMTGMGHNQLGGMSRQVSSLSKIEKMLSCRVVNVAAQRRSQGGKETRSAVSWPPVSAYLQGLT
jgi:hypothetical protein